MTCQSNTEDATITTPSSQWQNRWHVCPSCARLEDADVVIVREGRDEMSMRLGTKKEGEMYEMRARAAERPEKVVDMQSRDS